MTMRDWLRTGRVSRTFVQSTAIGAALLLGAAASASAGTLDQQQTASNSNAGLFSSQAVAQTFTPGTTGRVDQVDVSLLKVGTPPGPLVTAEIRGTSGGVPGGSPIATATIPISAVTSTTGAFLPFTFGAPAPVTAGTKYAIVVYTPGSAGNAVGWLDSTSDVYAGGGSFYDPTEPIPPGSAWLANGSADMTFKTYLLPPLPPTTPAPGGGAPVAPKKHCKKKKHKSGALSAKKKCKKKHHH
jgi:hypothetical protein